MQSILFFITSLERPGGAERVLTTLTAGWCSRGDSVTVVTLDNPDITPFFELDSRVKLIALGTSTSKSSFLTKPFGLASTIRRIREAIHSIQPEFAIGSMDQASMLLLMAARKLKTRVIATEHIDAPRSSIMTWPKPLSSALNKLRLKLYKSAHRVVVLTEGAKAFFEENGVNNLTTIPNPLGELPPAPALEEKETASPAIIGLGRLTEQKRFDLLLDAFEMVAADFPTWQLKIAGDGPLRESLQSKAEHSKYSDRIRFLGQTSTSYELLRDSEVFVLSSDFEGFPMVLCEALALECCCISTNCRFGPNEIIESGKNGILVNTGSVKEMAQALHIVMSDEKKRRQMAMEGRYIREALSIERILQKWDEVFAAT